MQKSDYRQVAAISQSALKVFRKMNPAEWKEEYLDKSNQDDDDEDDEETTNSMVAGSLVDTLAFEPQLFAERFYIPEFSITMPGAKVKQIVEKVYKLAKELVENKTLLNQHGNVPEELYVPNIHEISEFNNITLKVAKEIKYGGDTWSSTRILDNVYEDGNSYFGQLAYANGRHVITTVASADADQMVKNLKNHSRTAPYFVQQEGEILLFQEEIYEEYEYEDIKIPLKAAVDIIRIVLAEKRVYLPDLKTIYNLKEFREHAIKYGYLTQMSFYRFMVYRWLQTYRGGEFKDFEVMTPFDIAIDPITKTPRIFEFDEEDLTIIEWGSEAMRIKGWRHILNEIGWHIKNNVWNESKELHETGKIKLKFFND